MISVIANVWLFKFEQFYFQVLKAILHFFVNVTKLWQRLVTFTTVIFTKHSDIRHIKTKLRRRIE